MKPLLPIALNLESRAVLVVGGGAVAARKVAAFQECGALVRVVAPTLGHGFPEVFEHRAREFEAGDCIGFVLVVACTNDAQVNAQVADEAKQLGIWCNVADAPDASDFHTVAVVRRGEIAIGVSTSGHSPVLARHLKEKIEAAIGPEYEAMLQHAASQDIPLAQRGEYWKNVLKEK